MSFFFFFFKRYGAPRVLHSSPPRRSSDPRGLDYYRHTAFEFVTEDLGAQGAVIAGGRYDGLIESLGGPHTPAVGWAAGIERLAMLIEAPKKERADVAVVAESREREADAIRLAQALRREQFSVDLFVVGNPRKRYDRALKTEPSCTISFDVRGGVTTSGMRLLRPGRSEERRVGKECRS